MRKILIFCLVFLLSCAQRPLESNTNTINVPTSNLSPSEHLEISNQPEHVKLARKIEETIDQSSFSKARWGIFVLSLNNRKVLVSKDSDKAFIPASVMKILTSVVALDKLGKDFRWKTYVFAKGSLENGVLNGDLVLYGTGAPDFDDLAVKELVNQLKAKGLKTVKGNIIGDDSFFIGDKLSDGWTWNELQWYYGAEASALSINLNQTEIQIKNGKLLPTDDFIEVSQNLNLSNEDSIGVKRGLENNKFYIWGEGKSLSVKVSVQNPSLWAAKTLSEEMKKSGIKIEGSIKSADWTSIERTDTQKATEIASIESKPLGEIVKKMNKDSVNLYAELILRTLGRLFGREIPEEEPKLRKVRGDDRAGTAVIKSWLKEKGIILKENEVISDGSGLSRTNLLTPETVVRVLVAATQIKDSQIFFESLPTAGKDGTLRNRLIQVSGQVFAKTGSIFSVASLAGYIKKPSGDFLSFVIFCNNFPVKNDVNLLIDQIVTDIAT
ncbi:MAG: D-alanyl-D-alanine carboxypeptidase/D-alanyl-D-alanine-endopeptidase [Pyrinomonadaceae bacterium]|nr:D-alanyl-D-alanine carboxypeptidase/D-alanyl-D-alanine-endopeptidase [Pyrinomonadaceae bacterium]MCX7640175.1 D-alanyl-D-alanine carboxypeptidase/D-alanyl-D-alanine-endopeptidase [Pyrinomonadaceae bacterium]MDW8303237.1 D-alanyl-D-alanine carboxypeptidase/D-alanyl-D-alanine-endopeptidase [Acidobacteriota bacterium]